MLTASHVLLPAYSEVTSNDKNQPALKIGCLGPLGMCVYIYICVCIQYYIYCEAPMIAPAEAHK